MKKIYTSVLFLLSAITVSAQERWIIDFKDGTQSAFGIDSILQMSISSNTSDPGTAHDYVEIGGMKWATMNLGATSIAGLASECYGDYYAWGETEPRYTAISINGANSATFQEWKTGFLTGFSSYPNYSGAVLDAEHDAVTRAWGGKWRTPTRTDFENLYKACGGGDASIPVELPVGTTSTTDRGIYWCDSYDGTRGVLFSDGTNRVFFPAAGLCYGKSFFNGGTCGYYWSSSIYPDYSNDAYGLYFQSSDIGPSEGSYRYLGLPIRPVSE